VVTAGSRPPVRSSSVIFDVAIAVTLKPVVNDPQGLVVRSGLRQLGFSEVSDVRVGKYIQMRVEAADEKAARVRVTQMCEQLLRNPVIEDYRIGLEMQPETAQ
jgi:phosphoribosylformylglycinamidine synthase PurS subunit